MKRQKKFNLIEQLNHVLKMNRNTMTNTGIVYIEQVIKEIEKEKSTC